MTHTATYKSIALTAALLLLLTACSDDTGDMPPAAGGVTVELTTYTPDYNDQLPPSVSSSRDSNAPISPATRAWTPPSGYHTYDYFYEEAHGRFAMQKDLVNKSITAFFTQDGEDPLPGQFYYYKSTEWRLKLGEDLEEIAAGTYYLYGCIPSEDVTSGATISSSATAGDNSSYSSGAVLTLNGLNAVSASDVCVVVGAKEGTGKEAVPGLTTGQFATNFNAASKTVPGSNYIFLLFDHIYSALRFRFTINAEYDKLRTIKLRKLELQASGSGVKSKYNAVVTLEANSEGKSPIKSITFTPDNTSSDPEHVTVFTPLYIYSPGVTEAVLSSGAYTDFMGCFVPEQQFYNFKLRSTYDVYDKKGNLIRSGCVAENDLNIKSIFGTGTVLVRGKMYSVNITVTPTYLYVLSEPDLDSPTVTIN